MFIRGSFPGAGSFDVSPNGLVPFYSTGVLYCARLGAFESMDDCQCGAGCQPMWGRLSTNVGQVVNQCGAGCQPAPTVRCQPVPITANLFSARSSCHASSFIAADHAADGRSVIGQFIACRGCPAGGKDPPKTAQAWTLDDALQQLQLNPDDVYLQYVALQLASGEGKTDQVAQTIEQLNWRRGWSGRRADRRPDLFDLFTGALAVQESLQLDAMRGGRRARYAGHGLAGREHRHRRQPGRPEGRKPPLGQDAGRVRSWPASGPRSVRWHLCVPEDQYYVAFRSLTKLLGRDRRRRRVGHALVQPGGPSLRRPSGPATG